MSNRNLVMRALRAASPHYLALVVAAADGCSDPADDPGGGGGGGPVNGDGGTGASLSGFVSFHQEYDIPGIGANVACAPDAFSVSDWDTRFEPKNFGFMVSALQSTIFDRFGKATACGRCAQVTSKETGKSVIVRIIDRSTDTFNNGGRRFLDLSSGAFSAIGDPARGVLPADVLFLDCPAGLR